MVEYPSVRAARDRGIDPRCPRKPSLFDDLVPSAARAENQHGLPIDRQVEFARVSEPWWRRFRITGRGPQGDRLVARKQHRAREPDQPPWPKVERFLCIVREG